MCKNNAGTSAHETRAAAYHVSTACIDAGIMDILYIVVILFQTSILLVSVLVQVSVTHEILCTGLPG